MKITTRVEKILQDYPQTRSSDKDLMIYFWHFSGLELTPAQREKFRSLPSTESVRRVRQKIQEGGKYPATEKVIKERDFKSMQVQQIAPKATPQYIADTIEQRLFS